MQSRWYVLIFGLIGFALLLRIQVALYEERMIVDTAVSTFVISGTQFFDVTENRIAVGINQVLPVIVSYFTNNIHHVAMAFYANDYLWYLGFFLLFLFGFKQPSAALAVIVGYFTFLGYNYLIITCSIPIAFPIVILLMLLLRKQVLMSSPIARAILIIASVFILAFSNPINTITTLLFLAYFFSETWGSKANFKYYFAAGVLFVGFVILKNINPDPYDMQRVTGVDYEALADIDWPYIKYWTKTALTAFPISVPLLFFGMMYSIHLFRSKHYWKGFMLLGGYVYLVGIFVMYGVFTNHPYHDLAGKAMAPMAFLLSFIFAEWMMTKVWTKSGVVFVCILAGIAILVVVKQHFQINQYSEVARTKIAVYRQLIEQMPSPEHRYYIRDTYLYSNPDMPIINPLEIVVYSAMHPTGPYTAQIVVGDSVEIEDLADMTQQEIYHMKGSFYTIDEDNPFFRFTPNAQFLEYKPIVTLPVRKP